MPSPKSSANFTRELLLLGVAVLVALLLTADCQAQCPPPADLSPDVTDLSYQGAPGVWFPEPVARCVLADVKLLPLKLRDVSDLTSKVHLLTLDLASLRVALDFSKQEAVSLRGALDLQVEEVQDAHAWYRSPYLWFGVGLVLGAGGVTALVVSL